MKSLTNNYVELYDRCLRKILRSSVRARTVGDFLEKNDILLGYFVQMKAEPCSLLGDYLVPTRGQTNVLFDVLA
jgi:hypothetical protein